jgi:serine/threonine protein kinase/Flp pilus assembly protein TadD
MISPCPPVEQFQRLLAGQLEAAERSVLDSHLEACLLCQDRLDRLSREIDPVPEWMSRAPAQAAFSDSVAGFVRYLREHPPPIAENLLGQKLGPWLVVALIGRGGFGTVYLATGSAGRSEQTVALKVLNPGLDNSTILQRFRRERKILAGLEGHPYIVTLFDAGLTPDGRPWFVMEYVPGQPLNRFCDDRALTVDQRLELFLQVCAAVQYAHRSGVIHRDLKPGNILAAEGPDGEPAVKLLDFGIARFLAPEAGEGSDGLATRSGERLFTPSYASPEQVCGGRVDVTTDVYSLGVVLYELLCGHRPYRFEEATPEEVICRYEPEPPSARVRQTERVEEADGQIVELTPELVSQRRSTQPGPLRRRLLGDLDAICGKSLRKRPARRYQSVAELFRDIRRSRADEPPAAWGRTGVNRKPAARKAADPRSYHHLGLRLQAQGRHAEAEAAYRQAIALKPDYPEAYYNLALSLRAQEKHAEAEAAYRLAIALKPDFPEAYYNLGNSLRAQARHAEAEAAYREALAQMPNVSGGYNNLGNSLALQGRHAEAEAAYRQAVALEPDHPEAHYNLGKTLALQGRATEAEAAYRRAIELRPDHARAYFHLGNLLLHRGEHAAALTAFRHSHLIGSAQPGWRYPSAARLAECERRVASGLRDEGEGDPG